jgi:hypothetical protein
MAAQHISLVFEQYRVAEGRALVASSAEASRAVKDDLRARSGELRRQRAAYEQLIGSAREQYVAGRFDRTWADYIAISDELMGSIRQGARDEAVLIYNGKERTPVADARKAVAELMALQEREGEAAAEIAKTDQNAGSVRDYASGLNKSVEDLQDTLVRVVRTSTPDGAGVARSVVRERRKVRGALLP